MQGQCEQEYPYFKATGCDINDDFIDRCITDTPIQDECSHWKYNSLIGKYDIYYTSLLDQGAPANNSPHVLSGHFDNSVLNIQVNECIDIWSNVCNDFSPGVRFINNNSRAQCYFVWYADGNYYQIEESYSFMEIDFAYYPLSSQPCGIPCEISYRRSFECCPECIPFLVRTYLKLNNSPEFYQRYPQWKWVTEDQPDECGNYYRCFNFKTIMMRSIGMYSGLCWHDDPQRTQDVMYLMPQMCSNYTNGEQKDNLTACDEEHFRLMYCPSLSSVLEKKSSEEIDLKIFPNPSNIDLLSIYFNLNKDSFVEIELIDFNGVKIDDFVLGGFSYGENEYKMNVKNLSTGSYIINIIIDRNTSYSKKFVVTK